MQTTRHHILLRGHHQVTIHPFCFIFLRKPVYASILHLGILALIFMFFRHRLGRSGLVCHGLTVVILTFVCLVVTLVLGVILLMRAFLFWVIRSWCRYLITIADSFRLWILSSILCLLCSIWGLQATIRILIIRLEIFLASKASTDKPTVRPLREGIFGD